MGSIPPPPPPQFNSYERGYQQPPRKSKAGLWIVALLGSLAVVCGGSGFFLVAAFKKGAPAFECVITGAMASSLVGKYAKTTGKYPNDNEWVKVIREKYKEKLKKETEGSPIKIWDGSDEPGCSMSQKKISFYFNKNLSGKPFTKNDDSNPVVLFAGPFKEGSNLSALPSDFEKIPAPKMLGEDVGWMKFYADGNSNFGKKNKQFNVQID